MNVIIFVTSLIYGFMLAENRVSRRNERTLRAAGAVEPPGDVMLPLTVLYPTTFLVMAIEGLWRASHAEAPSGFAPAWALSGAVLFAASKALKYWAIHSLGERWSFRVLIQPGRPLVTSGPYQYVSHPNYIAVVGELVGAAMMVGAPVTGPLMLGAFGIVLWLRLRFEEAVLGGRVSFPQKREKRGQAS
jgi:methyltransferase